MTKSKPKKQVLGRVFRRLFKPSMVLVALLCLLLGYPQVSFLALVSLVVIIFRHPRIPSRLLIIGMPFLVAIIVALFTQYVVFIPTKSSSAVPGLILAGLIIGVPLAYKFRAKKIRGISLGAAIVIGFFLVPYFSFFLGKMHLFAVDQLPAGFRVIEMRISFDRCTMIRTDGSEVTAWPGASITLRPGMTRVYMGTLDIPAGTYIVRKFYMGRVEVDVEVDISNLRDTETGQPIPPENYQTAYDDFKVTFAQHLTTLSQQGSADNWSALDGSKFTFTITTVYPERIENIDPPMSSMGFGGPDLTLDLTLTENGEVTMTPILDLPPGFPSPA